MTKSSKGTAVVVAFLLGALGLFTSRPQVLQWLNGQGPIVAFLLWYVLLFTFIQIGSFLMFHKFDIRTIELGLGVILIAFAGGIVLYWPASDYSLSEVGANPSGVPSFLIASEDQLVYVLWRGLLPGASTDILGLLTYVLTPIVLVLVSGIFIAPRQLTAAFRGLLRTA